MTWEEFYETNSNFEAFLLVRTNHGEGFVLTNEDIILGSLSINDEICGVSEVGIGYVNSRALSVSIANFEGQYDGIDFVNASVIVKLGVQTSENVYDYADKGQFFIDSQKSGRTILLTGNDEMAQPKYNNPTNVDVSGLTCLQAIQAVGFTVSGTFPNSDYALPSNNNLSSSATPRDVLQYVCEITGCNASFIQSGDYNSVELKPLPVYNYSDNIDGGTFAFDDGDNVNGGEMNVSSIEGTNYLPAPDGSVVPIWTHNTEPIYPQTPYETVSYFRLSGASGRNVTFYGQQSGTWDDEITQEFQLDQGVYYLIGANDDGCSLVLKNVTKGTYVKQTKNIAMVVVEDETDYWQLILRTTAFNIPDYQPITVKPFLASSYSQFRYNVGIWTLGDEVDGGLFGLWRDVAISISEVVEIKKIMQQPRVDKRVIISGVRVSGENITTVSIGGQSHIIDIDNNPFITTQAEAQAVAQQVYDQIKGVTYVPFTCVNSADPKRKTGEIVLLKDHYGNETVSLCTGISYSLSSLTTNHCGESAVYEGE